MKNQPEKIYLNIGSDNMCFDHDADNDFNDLIEVTWSEDKIHESDLEYVMEPKWIKIESGADLPEMPTKCILIDKEQNMWIEELSKGSPSMATLIFNEVTHLLPLPQPPKQD